MTSLQNESPLFKRIGIGSFAQIWVYYPRGNTVVKMCSHDGRRAELHAEASVFRRIVTAVHPDSEPYSPPVDLPISLLEFRVPKFYMEFSSMKDFLKELRVMPSSTDWSEEDLTLPAFAMRRVFPVAGKYKETIHTFFPDQYKNIQAEFIVRVYLGRLKSKLSRFFNQNNFPLSQDRLVDLGLNLQTLSASMGKVLGRIVFKAGLDGRDIEFVLGGAEGDIYRGLGLWTVDFNQCKEHGGNAYVVAEAIKKNDPYYPLQNDPLFAPFTHAFLNESGENQIDFARRIMDILRGSSEQAEEMALIEL